MARGRPTTPLGTWGEISSRQLETGKWQSSTRLRLWNGETVRVRARANSKSASVNGVKEKCTERLGTSDSEVLTTTSPVSDLMEHWIQTKNKVRPQTRDRYRNSIDRHIVPALGEMRIREVKPSFLNNWLQALPSGVAPNVRTVLKGAFKMATRYGLIPSDPMQVVEPVTVEQKEVRALTREEIPKFRAKIARSGNETLRDVVDVSLATGLRAGEVLGIKWSDVSLEGEPPILRVSGSMVYSKDTGLIRQEGGKSANASRPIQLSRTCVEILQRRKEQYGALEMVFPSGAGTYLWENNFNRWLRKWRGDEFDWVTIHSLRKTLGSLVYEELGPAKAAEVLGHSSSLLTERVYVQRNDSGVPIGDLVNAALDGVQKVSKK